MVESLSIGFVSPGFSGAEGYPNPSGGIEYQVYNLAIQLGKRGHVPTIYRRFNQALKPQTDVRMVDIPVGRFPDSHLSEIPSRLLFSKRVGSRLLAEKPNIVHITERFSGWFPSRIRGVTRVFSTHNPDAMRSYRAFSWRYNIANVLAFDAKRLLEESVIRSVDAVFALNPSLAEYVGDLGAKRSLVVPNGVEIDAYTNDGDADYILYAGRIDAVKGIDTLMKAYAEVCEEFGVELRLVGTGRRPVYELEMRALARSLKIADRVNFRPWVERSKLRREISRCQFLVLPSRFETFGIVLLEAMASSKPVVATATVGARHIVEPDVNGFLVPVGDHRKLAEALRLLLADSRLRARFGGASRRIVKERYSFEAVGSTAEAGYRKCLAG